MPVLRGVLVAVGRVDVVVAQTYMRVLNVLKSEVVAVRLVLRRDRRGVAFESGEELSVGPDNSGVRRCNLLSRFNLVRARNSPPICFFIVSEVRAQMRRLSTEHVSRFSSLPDPFLLASNSSAYVPLRPSRSAVARPMVHDRLDHASLDFSVHESFNIMVVSRSSCGVLA